MNQDHLLKFFTSFKKITDQTSQNLKIKTSKYIKTNILSDDFVTREEYEQLRQLVLKMSKNIELLQKTIEKK